MFSAPSSRPRSPKPWIVAAPLMVALLGTACTATVEQVSAVPSAPTVSAGVDIDESQPLASPPDDAVSQAESEPSATRRNPPSDQTTSDGGTTACPATSGAGEGFMSRQAPLDLDEQFGSIATDGAFFGTGTRSVTSAGDQLVREARRLDDGHIVGITFDNNFYAWDLGAPNEPPELSAPSEYPLLEIGVGAGSLVMAGDQEGGLHVFDADNPSAPPRTFNWLDGWPLSVAGLCDGRFVAVSDNSAMTVWNPETDEVVTLSGADSHIRDLHQLADGRLIAASTVGRVSMWNVMDPNPVAVSFNSSFDNFDLTIVELDNGYFAVSDGTDRVQVFDPNGSPEPVARRGPLGDEDSDFDDNFIRPMAAVPDGRLLLVTANGGAEVWDPVADTTISLDPAVAPEDVHLEVSDIFPEDTDFFPEGLAAVEVTTDGTIVSLSTNGLLRLWQVGAESVAVADGTVIEPSAITTSMPGLNTSGPLVLVNDRTIAMLDGFSTRTVDIISLIAGSAFQRPRVSHVAIDGSRTATSYDDGSVTVVEPNGAQVDLDFGGGSITALALSETALVVATAGDSEAGPTVHLQCCDDSADGIMTAAVPVEVSALSSLDDNDGFLVGLANGSVLQLGLTGSLTELLGTDGTAVTAIVELPDGRVVVGTDASIVWVVDPTTGAVSQVEHPFGAPAPMVVTGDYLITSGREGRFRAWEIGDFDVEPIVIETNDLRLHAGLGWLTSVPGQNERFMVTNLIGSSAIVDFEGTTVATVNLRQFTISLAQDEGRVMVASPTGTLVREVGTMFSGRSEATDFNTDESGTEIEPETEVEAGNGREPELIWESAPIDSRGVVEIADSPFLFAAHELDDRTIVGVGGTEELGFGIWSWPDGDFSNPDIAFIEEEVSSVLTSVVVDDSWLVLSLIGAWDPEDPEAEDAVGRLEYWDLNNLSAGAQRVDEDQWVLAMAALDGGRFAFGDVRPPERNFVIRDVYDDTYEEFLSQQNVPTELEVLSDGRIATDGIAIWDPTEPERSSVSISSSFGAREIDALPGGGLVWGQEDSWGFNLLDGGGSQVLDVPGGDRLLVAPQVLPDGRILINAAEGLETYELGDAVELVASYPLPDGVQGPVFWSDLTITDTHAIGSARGDALWVWATAAPGADGVSFDGGKPLLALADGRILSGTDTGLIVWDPDTVVAGLATAQGALCDSASPAPGVIWIASEAGDVLGWNWRQSPAAGPDTVFSHDDEVSEMLVVGTLVVTSSHDGTIRMTDRSTGDVVSVVEHPWPRVTALALLADGRVAAGGADGTIIAFDPNNPEDLVNVGGQGTAEISLSGTTLLSLGGLADGRISAGFVENRLRFFEAVEQGAQVIVDHPGLPGAQVITRDGFILSPGPSAVLVFDPQELDGFTSMGIRAESYAVPVELGDGRIVTIDEGGTVWVNDRSNGALGTFEAIGSAPGTAINCLSALGDGLVAYADGRVVRIILIP